MIRPLPTIALLLIFTGGAIAHWGDDSEAPPESFRKDQTDHWSYRPINRSKLPDVKQADWVRNPIDRFVKAATEELGLKHAPTADRITLIRRVTYDLTGLPPTADEVFAFLSDPRPDAYEQLVDRLLRSPQYGVRWAQHWLDLAHYADSNGYEMDGDRPDAWRYRDWVVQALNDDMPYDRFLTLQIAGDEAEPGSIPALIATGFGRCGPREVVSGNIDPAVKRQGELTEITSTVGSVFLGLTMGCARCHDHKFDALPTTDYYRMQSFFASAQMVEKKIASNEEEEAFKAASKAIAEKIAPLQKRKAEIEQPYREKLRAEKQQALTEAEKAILAIPNKDRTPEQKKLAAGANKALNVVWEEVYDAVQKNPVDHQAREKLKREIDAIERTMPEPPAKAMALIDVAPKAPETFVLRRGELRNKGPKVGPRPPGIVLVSQKSDAYAGPTTPSETTTGRRLALAHWMTRSDNPLTARVIVNRLWLHHFGRGIVASPSDFGVRGEAPTHPELLDWLASDLIENGWKLKPIHRLMVTSATYRQASKVSGEFAKIAAVDDPENAFLWRMNRRRLDAEGLRDAMLVASGELNPKMGGPGVRPTIEKEVEDLIFTEAEVVRLWPETADAHEHLRRSIYLYRKRNVRYPLFDAFDAPDTQTACPQRGSSLHALQPLATLNSQFALDRAKALAKRFAAEPESNKIHSIYRSVLGRGPSPAELQAASDFLAWSGEKTPQDAAAKWVDFALAMLNRSEFLFVP
jgi:hypothetical protein